jgi:hypothetical protein
VEPDPSERRTPGSTRRWAGRPKGPEAIRRDRKGTGKEARDHLEEKTMTTSTTAESDNQARAAVSTNAASTAIDGADRSRSAFRREAVLVAALVALVSAVALFGIAFPGLLAPAVAIAVLAAIVALDWLLPSGELRQASARFWKH